MDPAQSAADAAWLTAWTSVGLLLLALVAAGVGVWQIKEAREARRQARDLADEVAQPYVVAFMEPSSIDPQLVDFVAKNFGSTGAEQVQITVTPGMQSAELGDAEPRPVRLPEVIPFLAPGQEWRVFWDSRESRRGSNLPDSHTASVTFADSRGKQHATEAVLDFAAHDGRTWVNVKSVHHVATSLKGIEKTLSSFKEGVSGGAKVWVRSGDEKDVRALEYRERLAERAEGPRSPEHSDSHQEPVVE
jgi:hypothetical protein